MELEATIVTDLDLKIALFIILDDLEEFYIQQLSKLK